MRSAVEVVLAIGVGIVTWNIGWSLITLGLATIVLESVAVYWNQRP